MVVVWLTDSSLSVASIRPIALVSRAAPLVAQPMLCRPSDSPESRRKKDWSFNPIASMSLPLSRSHCILVGRNADSSCVARGWYGFQETMSSVEVSAHRPSSCQKRTHKQPQGYTRRLLLDVEKLSCGSHTRAPKPISVSCVCRGAEARTVNFPREKAVHLIVQVSGFPGQTVFTGSLHTCFVCPALLQIL